MSRPADYAYIQARLQARHSRFPDRAAWRRLEAIGSLGHLLGSLRRTALHPWLSGIGVHSDVHQIEQILRRLFREQVAQVADWHPRPWRPALHWCAVLADLPAIAHLLEGTGIPHWIRGDPRLRPYTADLRTVRVQALSASPFAPLVDPRTAGSGLTGAWRQEWKRRWPDAPEQELAPLRRLARRLAQHHELLAGSDLSDSRAARTELEQQLTTLFRRHPQQPATAFIHLAITAVQLERLRGLLVPAALFGHEPEAA